MDEWVSEVKEKALDKGYDKIIIMSDHGLPYDKNHDKEGHNLRAFYSCNEELFPDKTPKITDFHDKILELVEE